ncbi:hemoglobin-like flavoprotein [Motilibacter peucedani]|uniref:Hemoglobin-like flavoprotein n=1 Tax=Motilibacter peucedani TaxID=598650 RepID=A0A420XQU0_9ACTN|nr:globin domain-containing protein [Motilibacter peucedani]RKS75586.1 hemoglobin-like flavoprotein [Motilibacter peucedani]
MTPEQVDVVDRTLAALRAPDAFAADFYRRLFAAAPGLRPLFPPSLEEQQRKFAAMLVEIAAGIREHDDFLERCADLGARHAGYGVRVEHYEIVGDALLAALAGAPGVHWDDEVQEAWQAAYALISDVMMGAQSAALPVSSTGQPSRPS